MFSFLLDDSDGGSVSTGGFGSLSSDSESPIMSESSVRFNFFHSFQVLSDGRFKGICDFL